MTFVWPYSVLMSRSRVSELYRGECLLPRLVVAARTCKLYPLPDLTFDLQTWVSVKVKVPGWEVRSSGFKVLPSAQGQTSWWHTLWWRARWSWYWDIEASFWTPETARGSDHKRWTTTGLGLEYRMNIEHRPQHSVDLRVLATVLAIDYKGNNEIYSLFLTENLRRSLCILHVHGFSNIFPENLQQQKKILYKMHAQ